MLTGKDEQELRDRIRSHEVFKRTEGSTCLIVFTHGLTKSPKDYEELLVALMKEEGEPFVHADLLPFAFKATLGANTELSRESVRLEGLIDSLVDAHSYEKVILVGHSIGGMLVRQTVLRGYQLGEAPGWVSKLERLVLLASANRGFVARELYKRLLLRASILMGRSRLLRDGSRGSKWMNNLRLGWILTYDQAGNEAPFTIQLRGLKDSVVSKYDSLDLYRFPNSIEIELEEVGHADFCGMTADHPAFEKIRGAFTQAPAPEAQPDQAPISDSTKRLVFLIHGIRDFGEWQDSLAWEIQNRDPKATVVSVRYGYFNIFQFLLPFQRRRAVRSFVDRYIQELAKEDRQTELEIAVAAHSNGTYVLANAMKSYPQIIVHRIYLAGSVLPHSFEWDQLSEKQRRELRFVRNDCANWDWPVGILCNGLRPIFSKSLGIAGYRGFETEVHGEPGPQIKDNLYLQGGHGAAFSPDYHAATASFLLEGEPQQLGRVAPSRKLMNALHYASWGLIPIVLIALALVYLVLIPGLPGDRVQVVASAIFTMLFILVLVRI